jgi:hypothetical protein
VASEAAARVDLAHQQLQNVVVAEAMLRQQRGGHLAPQDKEEIASLCGESLSDLYDHDWAAFQQYWQWLREVVPKFAPQHSTKLKLATMVVGYENAVSVATAYRRVKSSFGQLTAALFGDSQPALYEEALVGRRSKLAGLTLIAMIASVISLVGMMVFGRFGENASSTSETPRSHVTDSSYSNAHPISSEPRPSSRLDNLDEERRARVRAAGRPQTAISPLPRVEPGRQEPQIGSPREAAMPKGPGGPDRQKLPAETLREPATPSSVKGPDLTPSRAEQSQPEAAPGLVKEPTGPAVPPPERAAVNTSDDKGGERAASGEAQPKIAAVAVETPSPGIALAPVQPSVAPVAKESDAGTAATASISTPPSSEREAAEKMVARGERHLADGNVAFARQFFLRAANLGLARGAMLMAISYDPKELARMGAASVQPDVAVARGWYERARALGAHEAKELLSRLTND